MKIRREEFLRRLEACRPGLAARDAIEQSTSFVFEKGRICSFNEECACRGPSGLDESFSGAVRAAKLLEALPKMPEEEVDIEQRNGTLLVTGKRRGWEFVMEKEITLPIKAVGRPKEWTKLPAEFLDAVQMVQSCTNSRSADMRHACVHVHPKWVEATDQIQIGRYLVRTGVANPTLVKADSLRHVVQLGMTEAGETDNYLHFRNAAGLTLSCRRFVEDYEELGKFLDYTGGTMVKLPKGLGEVLDRATVASSENPDANHVTVEMRPGKLRIRGDGLTASFWESKTLKDYKGEPRRFMMDPNLLAELVRRHDEFEVADKWMKVSVGKYVYITALSTAPKEEKE